MEQLSESGCCRGTGPASGEKLPIMQTATVPHPGVVHPGAFRSRFSNRFLPNPSLPSGFFFPAPIDMFSSSEPKKNHPAQHG
jgi:hypothetical protein